MEKEENLFMVFFSILMASMIIIWAGIESIGLILVTFGIVVCLFFLI